MPRILVPALAALAAIAAAAEPAADGAGRTSLRFSLGTLPTEGEYQYNSQPERDQEWERAGRMVFGAWHDFAPAAPAAFNVGLGLAISSFSTTRLPAGDYKDELTEVGIFIEPGVAVHCGPHLTIEAGVPLGLGSVGYKEPDGDEFDGNYVEIGVVARPVLHLGSLQVYAELGALSNSSRVEDGPGNELTTTVSGATFALGLGLSL